MKISVIITVYNRTAFLREAIDSAIAQEPKPEIIVVDDGSEVSLQKEFDQIVGDYQHLIWLRIDKNQGVSHARNHGLKSATGDFVVFLDDDDLLMPDYFQKAKNYLMDMDVLMFKTKLFAENENTPGYRKINNLYSYNMARYHSVAITNPGYFLIYTPAIHAMIFRKALFYHFSFSESLDYGEDRLLLLQMRMDGLRIKAIDSFAAKYRMHGQTSRPADALTFLKLLKVSGLLQNHFQERYSDLLYGYFSWKMKDYIKALKCGARAITSRGVWSYIMGFLTFRKR